MRQELADFLGYCRIERRLAPLNCSAYERDVGTCIAFLEGEGLVAIGEVGRPCDSRPQAGRRLVRRAPPSCGRIRSIPGRPRIRPDPVRVIFTSDVLHQLGHVGGEHPG